MFNREQIDSLITDISGEKVLNAVNYYNKICEKITMHRKCRRSKTMKQEFLVFLGCKVSTHDEYEELMQQYVFMNTADLLLLNAFHNLKKNCKLLNADDEKLIQIAIEICRKVIEKEPLVLPSAATKNMGAFSQVQKACSKVPTSF